MQWLQRCLSSVVNSTVRADLFIVDNGSTDGSQEFIARNFSTSLCYLSETNLCFGKANNIGLRYALEKGYDYVYLLNQDAWVEPDTFEILIEASRKHTRYGILSPLQTNREGTKLDKIFASNVPPEVVSDALCGEIQPIYPVNFIMAAHWLMTREAVETVGGFSPTFPHYGEDDNYIARLKHWGYEVGIVTTTRAVHDREFRKVSAEHEEYRQYIRTIGALSQPDMRLNKVALCKIWLRLIFRRTPLTEKYTRRVMREMRSIIRNRKLGFSKGAFLQADNVRILK